MRNISYFVGVKTILRYLIFSGALVAITWAVFTVKVGNRSVYSHLRNFNSSQTDTLLSDFRREFEAQQKMLKNVTEKVKSETKPKTKSKELRQAKRQELRVKKLQLAAKKATLLTKLPKKVKPVKKATKPREPAKTRTDNRISIDDEKALDELLSARLDRLK
ncbi:MAG: hypothetical protein VYC39_03295 [Myxococcota bacterium]|nr:hypothetical protein [Myxococcota bacterium]